MGKIQSKRSVDITTEGNQTQKEDDNGKLEKFADLNKGSEDNCIFNHQKCSNNKKLESEEYATKLNTVKISGTEPETAVFSKTENYVAEKTYNNEGRISSITEIPVKKPKIDKVKKQWSFRNISFGKKDKQKLFKSEEMPSILTNEVAKNQTYVGCDGADAIDKDDNGGSSIDSPDKNSYDKLNHINISLKKDYTISSNTTAISTGNVECGNNENIREMSDLIVPLHTDIKLPSEKVNDNCSTSSIRDECEMNTNIQLSNLCIEVNNDAAKNVTTNFKELITIVDNSKESNEISNVNLCYFENLNIVSCAPPLPSSPPPSQVLKFSLSPNTKSEISKSDEFILKSMEIDKIFPFADGNYIKIEEKGDESCNPQKCTNSVEYQVTQNEFLSKESFDKITENNCKSREISNEKFKNCTEFIKSSRSFNGNNESLKESKNLFNISSFPQSHINSNVNANDIYSVICEYQSQHDQQIATTIVDEISETAVIIHEDQNKDYSALPSLYD